MTITERIITATARIDAAATTLGEAYAELTAAGAELISAAYRDGGRHAAENLHSTASTPAIAREVATLLHGHGLATVLELGNESANYAPIDALSPRWTRMLAGGQLVATIAHENVQ